MNAIPTIPAPLDRYENAIVQHLKRSPKPAFGDLLLIWGWRNSCRASDIPLSHLAERMYDLADRCGLLGMSFATPGASGGMGVLIDASPCREWACIFHELPDTNRSPLYVAERAYWIRVISVLASRLMLAPVDQLPGYDHESAAGPFGQDYL